MTSTGALQQIFHTRALSTSSSKHYSLDRRKSQPNHFWNLLLQALTASKTKLCTFQPSSPNRHRKYPPIWMGPESARDCKRTVNNVENLTRRLNPKEGAESNPQEPKVDFREKEATWKELTPSVRRAAFLILRSYSLPSKAECRNYLDRRRSSEKVDDSRSSLRQSRFLPR